MPMTADMLGEQIDIPDKGRRDPVLESNDDQGVAVDEEFEGMALGFIIDEPDDKKVAQHIDREVEEQVPQWGRNMAVWKRNAWWREGKRWVRLEKKENMAIWEAKLPPGMANAPPVPNKTDRLCRRTVNVIMVDPPYPECEPGNSGPEAKDAAEFSTRLLEVRGSPTELNMKKLCRRAMGKAMTYGSSFAWVIMDPTGAGHRPRQVMAHPAAETQADAVIDPETEAPAPEEALVPRYVRADRTLTDNAEEAELQWLPGERVRMLTGKNVLFLPQTAESLREAIGVLIVDHTTLGDLRQQFPDKMKALTDAQMDDLCGWKPERWKDILPPYSPEPEEQKDPTTKKWKDSQLVWTITVYYRRCAEYPKGCYAIKAGKESMLYRDRWTAMFEQPPADDGTEQPEKEEVLRIPLAQCKCLDDDNYDSGYGIGMAEHLGPADEIRASSLGYQLEYLFRFGNPIQFLPMGSIVQPKQLQLRDGNPVYFNPQGTPVTEDVPQLPAVVPELRSEMSEEMDDESGLQQTGQGVESKDVHSGVHARTVVQEALKAISNMKDNLEDFYIDLNTIILEQHRAFSAVPTLLSFTGKDAEYKAKEWSRTDIANTKNVSIRRGSFTMHTLTAKQELANDAFDRKVISPEEYQELVGGGVAPILGYQENPHLLRIRRQLDQFDDGPPEGWMEQMQASLQSEQAIADYQQRAQAASAILGPDGQPVPFLEPPPEQVPPPPGVFDRALPIDDLPEAAKVRHRQIVRFIASSKYEAFPPEWCATLEKEEAKARNSAGIMTVPDVQKQQAQQAQDAKAAALVAKTSIGVKADPSTVAGAEEAVQAGATAAAAGQSPDMAPAAPSTSPSGQGGAAGEVGTHYHIHLPQANTRVQPLDVDHPPM
jgi:hypothetical protein